MHKEQDCEDWCCNDLFADMDSHDDQDDRGGIDVAGVAILCFFLFVAALVLVAMWWQ